MLLDNLFQLQGISKAFYGSLALDKMDLSMKKGEVHCLVGENGCGKSTLIKIISGFYDFDEGKVIIDGTLYPRLSPIDAIRKGIQVIYQDFSLFPNLSVGENITMLSRIQKKAHFCNWKTMKKNGQDALDLIGVRMDLSAPVSELNVSQKQLVAIARAVIQDARLIIMDEPTSALTQREIARLLSIVDSLKKRGIAILFVSHKMNEVLQIADNVTVMRKGRNVYSGAAEKLTQEDLIYYMTGKRITANPPDDTSVAYDSVLMDVKGLTLPGAFENICFTLHPGEVLGVTGLLDCGRNELAKSLFGLLPAKSGEVAIEGKKVRLNSIQSALQNHIGYVPEDRLTEGLHLDQPIGDNAIIRILGRFTGFCGLLKKNDLYARRDRDLSSIHIAGMHVDKLARSLSGGNQQKVVLVKWLAENPRILILNCPTVGVDIGAKSDIHAVIRKLAQENKIGVILISDDTSEILAVCNRVLVMSAGKIVEEARTADISIDQLEALQVKDYAAS